MLTYGYDLANNRTLIQDSQGGTTTMTFDVLNPRQVASLMHRQADKIRSQYAHITVEHGQDAPAAMEVVRRFGTDGLEAAARRHGLADGPAMILLARRIRALKGARISTSPPAAGRRSRCAPRPRTARCPLMAISLM